jgi:hypothetical protein
VPPAHQRDWRHNCSRYAACGQPVYFVRDDYYREHYVRHDRHDHKQKHKNKHKKHRDHDDDDDDD